MRIIYLFAAAAILGGCATPASQLAQMSNAHICNLMVQNPNTDFNGGQQVLLSRGASCTDQQYQYIYAAQLQHRQGMAAMGAYGMQMQANSYRQVAPVMPRPVTCQKVGYTVQCF